MSEIKHVSVNHEYFLKAKNDYNNWVFAFFREVIQNSFDAGATKIYFTIEQTPDGNCRIVVQDNGSGMELDICETKFLALRQSTKTGGAGSTGAFGVAKEIIAFAHQSYTLESKNYRIVGDGGIYQVFDNPETNGVKITVVMNDVSESNLVRQLKNWTEMSNFPCQVFLDGKKLEGSTSKYPHSFDIDFGSISFRETGDPDCHSSRLIVRMNGMAMYSRDTYTRGGAFEAVLNLSGSSQERLTSNRDSLTGGLESSLTQILNQLSNNRGHLTLGEPMIFEFNQNRHGGQTFQTHFQPQNMEKIDLAAEIQSLVEAPRQSRRIIEEGGAFADQLSRLMLKKEYKTFESSKNKILNAIDQVDESAFPENWIVRISAANSSEAQKNIKRMNAIGFVRFAYTWQILVTYILLNADILRIDHESDGSMSHYGRTIKFGFAMDNVKALCSTSEEDICIMINPFKDRDLYNVDFEALVSRAIHEVSHILTDDHGEYLVDCMEQIAINLRRGMRQDPNIKGSSYKGLERYIKSHIPACRY